MELTKEHFDQTIKGLATKNELKNLATKDDLQKAVSSSEKKIIARIDEAQEELAQITSGGFDDVLDRLDVRERMQKLEKEMAKIKVALHLS